MAFEGISAAVRDFLAPKEEAGGRSAPTAVLLVSLCFLLWMLPAGLWDLRGADETRYVLIAREWLAGDGGIKLTLLGQPYDQKPPLPFLLYALMLAANGGDVSNWAVRLPSVLLGTAGVLATWRIGRRHLGERAGLLAALVLATSSQWMIDTPTAELNVMFSGWIALSLACWFLRPEGAMPWRRALAMWLLLAAAFFTKGPLAILVVVSVLAGECVVRRSFAPLREARLWQGLLLNGILIAAWLLAQRAEAGSAFVEKQVVGQTVDRFVQGDHEAPPWYYVPRLFASIMCPWAILLVPAGFRWWREWKNVSPFSRTALLGWIGLPFAVLSLASGKRETYMLPLLPGFALIVGSFLDGLLARGETVRTPVTRHFSRALASLAILCALLLCTAGIVVVKRPDLLWNHDFLLRRWQIAPIAVLAALFAWTAIRLRSREDSVATPVAGAFALLFLGGLAMFTIAYPATSPGKSTRRFAEFLDRFLAENRAGKAVGLLDRAAKPEYHVYGNYLGVPLEKGDLNPGASHRLPNVLVVREGDWKDVEANRKRMADAGYAAGPRIVATGDELTLYLRSAESASTTLDGALQFALVGDTGSATREGSLVAGEIADLHRQSPLGAVFLLGDNVYDHDPFERAVYDRFERVHADLISRGVPFCAALGNHDVNNGYARKELGYRPFGMEGRRYFERTFGDDLATFFVLDHYTLATSPDQILWLKERLLACRSKWKFVATHEPLHSSTDIHHLSEEHRAILLPVLRQGGVQAVFSGHLHFYERPPFDEVLQITSGAGCETDGPDAGLVSNGVIFDSQCSFLHLSVSESAATCEAIAADGTIVDSFRIAMDGSGIAPPHGAVEVEQQ